METHDLARPRLYVGQRYEVRPESGAYSFAAIAYPELAVEMSKVSLHGWDGQSNLA